MATLLALFSSRSFRCCSRLRLLSRFFNAQTDTALAINFQNFHRYFLTHLQVIGHFLNAFVSDLRDVYQTFFTAADGNKMRQSQRYGSLYHCRRGPLRFLQ